MRDSSFEMGTEHRSALIINLIFILIAFEMKPNQGRAWQHWRLFIEISAE